MAGDDHEALKVASMLVRDAGFDPAVLGGLDRSRIFEQTNPLYGQEISAQEMIARAKAIKWPCSASTAFVDARRVLA